MKTSKKAFTPIVAVSLLLVTVSISMFVFNSWHDTFQGNLINKVSSGESVIQPVKILDVIGNSLYVNNPNSQNISLTSVKIGFSSCSINQNLTIGKNLIDLSSCSYNGGAQEFILVTTSGVFEKIVYTTPNSY